MKLLILNGPRSAESGQNAAYRGTYRAHPSHCNDLPDDSEINQLFFWFIEEGGEFGLVNDLEKATRLAELHNRRLGYKCFEVVELIDPGHSAKCEGILLGYDLSSAYNNSLLQWGLRLGDLRQLPNSVQEACEAVRRTFAPSLNRFGLFDDADIASQCLQSMTLAQRAYPGLFEGGDLADFEVIGIQLLGAFVPVM